MEMSPAGSDWIEFAEGYKGIAALLKVSEATVWRWIKAGKLSVRQPFGPKGKVYLARDVAEKLMRGGSL